MATRPDTKALGREPPLWVFERQVDAPSRFREPVTLRHPEGPWLWRVSFDPPLAAQWQALDWAGPPDGVVDARLTLVFDDGSRLPQPLAKTGRNRCRAMFRPPRPLRGIEVMLAGSSPPETWPAPVLRPISVWDQRVALLRRGLSVLRGDPRSLPWRAARFLIQLRRQGRGTIPLTTLVRSESEAYKLWQERFDERDEDRFAHESRLAGLIASPLFTLVADPDIAPEEAEALAASLRAQIYGAWEFFVPDAGEGDARIKPLPTGASPAARLNAALALGAGRFVFLPRPGTILRPHALVVIALVLQHYPAAKLIYADDDDIGPGGRRNPRFKPAWSPLRALAWDYLGDLCGFDAALLRGVGGVAEAGRSAQRHDLLLRASASLGALEVIHVAQVLSHTGDAARAALTPEDRAVVRAHVEVAGAASRVVADPRSPHPHVVHDIGEPPPLVSIIVPTRDRADLLRLSIGSIKARTRYPAYEILIVDNGSREDETFRLFETWADDASIRVLKDAGPFNYSRLNNDAAAQAKGTLLALVNNDIEVLDPLWLSEMVGLARQTGVGCVGAKLFYPDGRLQHGGVVTGVGGAAGHRHKRSAPGAPGMVDCLVTVNEVSAVTGACLLVRKDIYDAVGGLDAESFAVGYNDVDFCLKVAAAGYRNVWTPFAELNHHESVSRGRDLSARTMERFNREVLALRLRWGNRLIDDPYASPNLTRDSEDGGIRTQ